MTLDPNQANLDKVSASPSGEDQAAVSLAGHDAGRLTRKSVVREYAEAIIVAIVLAFVPYLILRGPFARFVRARR